jgi:hypothetical protein
VYKKLGKNIDKVKLRHNEKMKLKLAEKLKKLEADIKQVNEVRKYAQVSHFKF